MDITEIIKEYILRNLQGKKLKITLCIIAFLFTWFFFPDFKYDFDIKGISFDLIIRLVVTIFLLIIILVTIFKKKKNKTKLPGIGFYINSSLLSSKDIRKTQLFHEFKEKLKGEFEIIVYEKDDLNISKLIAKDKSLSCSTGVVTNKDINAIIHKLNLSVLFIIDEKNGGKKLKNNIYEISFLYAFFYFPFPVNEMFINSFRVDLLKSMNSCIDITNENSLSEINEEVSLFEIQIKYLFSIIYSLLLPDKALDLLGNISGILKVTNINKNNLSYIEKNLPIRYIDAYYNMCLQILYYDKYYSNLPVLKRLESVHLNLKNQLDKCFKLRLISKREYINLLNDYYLHEAIIMYEKKDIPRALEAIYKVDLTLGYNDGTLFSKAFLLACNGDYDKSYALYKRLLKKKIIMADIKDIVSFIEDHFEYNPEDISLKFCLSILYFYYEDKKLSQKYMQEALEVNSNLKDIYEDLFQSKK